MSADVHKTVRPDALLIFPLPGNEMFARQGAASRPTGGPISMKRASAGSSIPLMRKAGRDGGRCRSGFWRPAIVGSPPVADVDDVRFWAARALLIGSSANRDRMGR
jgi:hypothetical protein